MSQRQLVPQRCADGEAGFCAAKVLNSKCGRETYELAEHDSLKISNGKWYWFSRGFGGMSALDFLIKVRNMDFVSAVNTLIDSRASPIFIAETIKPINDKPKEKFVLPDKFWDNFRVTAYLMNRGSVLLLRKSRANARPDIFRVPIDREIINYCITKKSAL